MSSLLTVPKTPASRLFNIFLLKKEISAPAEIFTNLGSLEQHPIRVGNSKVGELYVRPSKSVTPSWTSLFAEALDVGSVGIKTSSASAVLLVPRGDRIAALAFGQGRHLLNPSSYEENFGLLATLNSVDPNRVRILDRKRFDALARLTREQASHEVPIVDFGLEIERDMVRSLTGVPSDPKLGKRLSGRDSLAAVAPATLKDLPGLLDLYIKRARATGYRNTFPWVDSIEELRDPDEISRLHDTLLDKLRNNDFSKLWLVVPDLLDWTDVEGFRCSGAKDATLHSDIHVSTYLDGLKDRDALSISRLKRHRLMCISSSNATVLHDWPMYRCLYAEIEDRSGTFLLDNGKWYRLDTDLVAQVDREVRRIPSTALSLPAYTDGETEEQYNKRFAAGGTDYALMDRKVIRYGGGRSQIEFCDVYTRSRIMVHVKRYGGSSVLSHLFAQGTTSAAALLFDESFRIALNKRLPASHRLTNPRHRPTPGKYEVAFCIASKSQGPLALPFFSRVTLRNAFRQLSSFGFKVSCSRIPVS